MNETKEEPSFKIIQRKRDKKKNTKRMRTVWRVVEPLDGSDRSPVAARVSHFD